VKRKGSGFEYQSWFPPGVRHDFWTIGKRRAPHVLVEGPFDAIRVWRAGFHVTCCFGKPSFERLVRLLSFDLLSVILLDSDAVGDAKRLHRQLRGWGLPSMNRTPQLALLGKKDPDECTEQEIRDLLGEELA